MLDLKIHVAVVSFPISALGESHCSDQTFHKAAAVGYEAVIKVKNVNEINFDIKQCPGEHCVLLQNVRTATHHCSDIITRQGPSVTVDNE